MINSSANQIQPWPPVGIDWYYSDESCCIACADCRDILPLLPKVDLVLTDPPWGINGKKTGVRVSRNGKGDYTSDFEDTPEFVCSVVVPVINLCLNICKRLIVTPGGTNLWKYPEPTHTGLFYYPCSSSPSSWGLCLWSPILFYGKDPHPGKLLPDGRLSTETASHKGHPCAKPEKTWKWLLHRSSLPNETVLDPFMGSGTTLRAAKDLGRKAIGIEINEQYCEIAKQRLAQEVLPLGS